MIEAQLDVFASTLCQHTDRAFKRHPCTVSVKTTGLKEQTNFGKSELREFSPTLPLPMRRDKFSMFVCFCELPSFVTHGCELAMKKRAINTHVGLTLSQLGVARV